MKRVAVIGGGASGMMAAITAAQHGAQVIIYEKNERLGKKILATGNGKCNYSNKDFHTGCYHGTYKEGLDHIFKQFSVQDTVTFFQESGMISKERNGYLYPLSEQASTVLDILRLRLRDLGVTLALEANVKCINKNSKDGMFTIEADGKSKSFHSVVIACGGCAAPKTGSDGSGYRLAKQLGHNIIDVVPALVQLRCQEDFFKGMAGVRCDACIKPGAEGGFCIEERGEVQFTDYGISGIPVFQLSRTVAYMLKTQKKVSVYIDFFPGYDEREYEELCLLRLKGREGKSAEEFLTGMANKKINMTMLKLAGLKPAEDIRKITDEKLMQLLYSYRNMHVHVTGTNSFDNAQVSAGGVDMREVTAEMESVFVPGIYFAGEILDIDGRCGGYNLQWAWTSGYIAGKNAAGLRQSHQ